MTTTTTDPTSVAEERAQALQAHDATASELQSEAKALEARIEEATTAGDPDAVEAAHSELDDVRNRLEKHQRRRPALAAAHQAAVVARSEAKAEAAKAEAQRIAQDGQEAFQEFMEATERVHSAFDTLEDLAGPQLRDLQGRLTAAERASGRTLGPLGLKNLWKTLGVSAEDRTVISTFLDRVERMRRQR